jgi:hypothetical protein
MRAVAPGVGYAGDRGRVADARLVIAVVGAPEGGELALQVGACSLLALDEPSQNHASGPDSSRIASSLSPISLIACPRRSAATCRPPASSGTSAAGSPWPCSRTAAPLAQCAPRLMGLSKAGSCPTHTPFCTSAMVPQPTEQWPQTGLCRLRLRLDRRRRGGSPGHASQRRHATRGHQGLEHPAPLLSVHPRLSSHCTLQSRSHVKPAQPSAAGRSRGPAPAH